MALLEISDLRFAYPDGFHVGLEQLELEPGGTAAIVGVSGSGKSTLLECIGLLNLGFRAQRFTLCGQALDLTAPRAQLDALRVRCIGYMPQNSALLPFLSIRDNLLCQIRLVCGRNLTRGEDMDYLAQLQPYFAQLKMERLLGRMPHEISVGQRQRASFLKAIAARPQLLLIDEPTSSLDRHNAEQMFACIRDIAQAEGIGVVVVTHDLQGVREFAVCAYDEASGQFRPRSPSARPPPAAAPAAAIPPAAAPSPVQAAASMLTRSAAPPSAASAPAPSSPLPPAPRVAMPSASAAPAPSSPPPPAPAAAPAPASPQPPAPAAAPTPAAAAPPPPAPRVAMPSASAAPAPSSPPPPAPAAAPAPASPQPPAPAAAPAPSSPPPEAAVMLAMRSPVVEPLPSPVPAQPAAASPPSGAAAPAPVPAASPPAASLRTPSAAPSLRARRGGPPARAETPAAAAAAPTRPTDPPASG